MRLGGYLLDGLLYGLLYLPFFIAGAAFLAIGIDDCPGVDDEIVCAGREKWEWIVASGAAYVVGFLLVVFLYLRALARSGLTWGRRIVKIKVVDSVTGGVRGWDRAIGRSLVAASISASVFYLGYLWMLWDDENQIWHDKVASTCVVCA